MKTIIAIVFVFLPAFLSRETQRKITGIVTDINENPIQGVLIRPDNAEIFSVTGSDGTYSMEIPAETKFLHFAVQGFLSKKEKITASPVLNVRLEKQIAPVQTEELSFEPMPAPNAVMKTFAKNEGFSTIPMSQPVNTENYSVITENNFKQTSEQAVTTFSIDVDRASYSNVRRFLLAGQMPPADAVRVEEMINYFDYQYREPAGEHPVSIETEMTDSPWNKGLKLVSVGLRARSVPTALLPPSNLVFLIDVSGSMSDDNKLPLLKQSFKLLTDQLRPQDKVAIVVYAGAAGIVLPPTSGNQKLKIREALENLEAGGSTAGGEGINLAYRLAKEGFIANGNNRVILATDGDFNVGVSSESQLQRLIEQKREAGIYLSVLGFGSGNYKDSQMETLADKGNGNYAYIDNIQEARKQFVQEFGGTLFTIAKDVKIQVEFNPQHVQAYRLIGYENRALQNQDFTDDTKDAGEMGSGHSVTAIYEIVPAGSQSQFLTGSAQLKYQKNAAAQPGFSDELMTLKVRYKKPEGGASILFEHPVKNKLKALTSCSKNLRFALSVAEFGLLLRNSPYKGTASYDSAISRARTALGEDKEGYRSEFLQLVKMAKQQDTNTETAQKSE